jgi:hypothetical protein
VLLVFFAGDFTLSFTFKRKENQELDHCKSYEATNSPKGNPYPAVIQLKEAAKQYNKDIQEEEIGVHFVLLFTFTFYALICISSSDMRRRLVRKRRQGVRAK